ncbi:MAG: hypothetical protein ACPGU9_00425 [Flavobacteriaceae bacterium]
MKYSTFFKISSLITIVIALIIICDFSLPGKEYTSQINTIKKDKQQYFNAAGNHHYSYTVKTDQHQFLISKEVAKTAQIGRDISYKISLLFNQVNTYSLTGSNTSNIYSLRLMSGLIAPLLLICSIAISYGFKKNLNLFISVQQIILIVNVILLIITGVN